jgi:catechol 2,3-dioxygenase
VFFTSRPDTHHQFVLANGRDPEDRSNVINQISFRLDSLAELKRVGAAILRESLQDVAIITHGTAWSVYFRDPEGNRMEVFVDTPWYIDQPFRAPINLELPEQELREWTEALCRGQPGFQSIEEFQRKLVQRFELAKNQ